MIPRRILLLSLLAGAALAADSRSSRKSEPRVDPSSYEYYRPIADHNIFNPNRSGRIQSDGEAPRRVDMIALVGTMDYEKGVLALFDGSDRSYRKAAHVGEAVGPFKVANIAPNTIEIERDGKKQSMAVGQQLRKPEGGDWTMIGIDTVRAEAAAAAAQAAAAAAPPPIPPDASEALRRLMEQRQKQLKQ
jgi:hypothetical protein